MSVTGSQAGTATFEVYRTWTLNNGVWTGSDPREFTVAPRAGNDPATTFATVGTVVVNSGQAAGTFNLAVRAFDITNTNTTGGKLAARGASDYDVVASAAPPPPSDTTPPVIAPSIVGTLGSNGWYTSDVTLSWTVTDLDSTVTSKTGCGTTNITSDQTATEYTCTATSGGGTTSEKVSIKRDATSLGIVRNLSADSCSAPGLNGWCRGAQTADFKACDAMSGLWNGESSPWAFTKSTSDNGSAVTISSGTVDDMAGHTSSAIAAGPYMIDSVNPTISGTATPAPNPAGWNKTDVDVDFTCSDMSGSGVASCGPDTTVTTEGRDQSVVGTAKDTAGNTATDTVSDIDIDKTGPSAPNATTTPLSPASGGWFKDTVTVAYSGSVDPILTDGSAGSGVKGHSGSQTFNTSGTHAYSGKATDNADNDSAAKTPSVNVDATNPSVGITGCPTAPVILGSTQAITVSANDVHSGLVSDPSGSVTLNTSTVGWATETINVADKVGHTNNASCTYSVIYNWTGFFQPIDNGGMFNQVQAGRTIPAKFSLGGDQGMNILSATMSPSSIQVPCPAGSPVANVEETSTATVSGLKYDPLANQYIYNWKTLSTYVNTCRQLTVTLADDTKHTALFKFTK